MLEFFLKGMYGAGTFETIAAGRAAQLLLSTRKGSIFQSRYEPEGSLSR
jgi:hypothetical protein